jgi:hypothetical protein
VRAVAMMVATLTRKKKRRRRTNGVLGRELHMIIGRELV